MYNQAMNNAKGIKCGTREIMTDKEARKFNTPYRHIFDEPQRFESMVFMSVVKRFRILPMGVTSKKRTGALERRYNRELKMVRDA